MFNIENGILFYYSLPNIESFTLSLHYLFELFLYIKDLHICFFLQAKRKNFSPANQTYKNRVNKILSYTIFNMI